MNPLYNAGIRLYRLGARMAASRNPKAAKMIAGQKETFGILESRMQPGRRYVWMHVSSLGEFEQGRPLLERIRRENPSLGIILSFFSPSGYEVRKNYDGADIICYLPFDTPANARRWVETVRPVAAIFVKYEFWGNYISTLRRHGVPTYLISAIFRDSQPFFRWWGTTFRRILRCYDRLFVQDEPSARRLAAIGITNVDVAGDTRFDRVTDIMRSTREIPGLDRFAPGKKKIIFGSSWEADEQFYIPWLKENPSAAAIIAPHEFDEKRLRQLAESLSRKPGDVMMLSRYMAEAEAGNTAAADGVSYLIVDSFGLLSSIYRYGDIAYVGGGFGHGIHNINEAAVYGMPVVFGPHHSKFKEASDLISLGGGFETDGADNTARILSALTSDDSSLLRKAGKAAGDYIASSIGATDRIFPKLGLS